jgi:hypothetical protein
LEWFWLTGNLLMVRVIANPRVKLILCQNSLKRCLDPHIKMWVDFKKHHIVFFGEFRSLFFFDLALGGISKADAEFASDKNDRGFRNRSQLWKPILFYWFERFPSCYTVKNHKTLWHKVALASYASISVQPTCIPTSNHFVASFGVKNLWLITQTYCWQLCYRHFFITEPINQIWLAYSWITNNSNRH